MAVWSLALMVIGMLLLGLIPVFAPALARVSPLRLVNLFVDQPLDDLVLAAGVTVPLALTSSAFTATALTPL